MAGVIELIELGCPHLILADFGGYNCFAASKLMECFDDVLRLDDVIVFFV
jgi:hypothetical protein